MRKINYLFFSILPIIIANDYELSIVLFLQGFGVHTKSLLIFVRWFEIMTFNVMNRMVRFAFYVSFTFIFLSFWFNFVFRVRFMCGFSYTEIHEINTEKHNLFVQSLYFEGKYFCRIYFIGILNNSTCVGCLKLFVLLCYDRYSFF